TYSPVLQINIILFLCRPQNQYNLTHFRFKTTLESSAKSSLSVKFECFSIHAKYLIFCHCFLQYKHHKEESDPSTRIEGKETDDWLCIDFGNIVLHLMLPETREAYELEKLWTLGSYDDQLAQMIPQSLPEDFIFGPI
ncbi:MASU1 protein, partial [Bucorvus abyssinicus]|nr:MASU1 protein [Bucorvus abyssinicus]